jgi:hypothetical protein
MSQVSRFGAIGRAWHARPSPLRSNDGLLLLESFLVAAVISVLVIRWFLTLADFPRLGSGGLHIAHMLWGGALMLVAIVLLLAYLDRPVQHAAAFIAGLGFGTFIDEIGKFMTTDNDYFFRPAVSLIYVVFVVVFLVAHALVGQRRLTEREALANALDLLEPRLDRPIEGDDRGRIEDLLDQAGRHSGLVDAIARYLDELPGRPDEQSWWEAIPRGFARHYEQVAVHPLFSRALTAVVLLYTAAAVVGSMLLVAASVATDRGPSAAALGQLLSTLLGAALVVRGILALPTSHIAAYRWFLRGVLVWLLITQVFIFYDSQPIGLAGLALDVIAYAMLRYAISHETVRSSPRDQDSSSTRDRADQAVVS